MTTYLTTPLQMTEKQDKYIVDLTVQRPNWIATLSGETYETVADVLVNQQLRAEKKVEKFIERKAASKAISALLAIQPTPTVAPTQPQTLKQVATKWINEVAAVADVQPAPTPEPTPVAAKPAPIQRLRQMIDLVPESPHLKFALTNDKGVVEFFSLDTVKSKYQGGKSYRRVCKLIGAPGNWHRGFMSVHQQLDIMRQWLRYGWEQGCKDYATKHGRCSRCDAYLSDPQSIAAKVGKDCAEALGWPW